MNSAKDKLKDAAGMLSGLAEELGKIPGVGDAAAKQLNDGSGTIGGVATEMENLAGNMQDLSGILAGVGEALKGLGEKLSESGGSVKNPGRRLIPAGAERSRFPAVAATLRLRGGDRRLRWRELRLSLSPFTSPLGKGRTSQ